MARDPETQAHQEWLGYVQPVGLVVSIPALVSAQAYVNRNIIPDHQRFLSCLPRDKSEEPIPEIRDFAEFVQTVLGWRESDMEAVAPGDPQYAGLEVTLPEYHETLRPTHIIREPEPTDASRPWMMLLQILPSCSPFDEVTTTNDRHWQATPQAKFERLLRETQVPLGLLTNNTQLRIVYAPRGETSGYMTFSVPDMVQVAGRSMFAALHMLLCAERLFSLGEKQRLPAILADSRKYQNVVSTQLAEQVLAALYELVRGFQDADEQSRNALLREVLAEDPNHVYGGLLTVLMRLVFILYAEDRGLLSNDAVYTNFYAVTGLFDRLRADAGRYPDTMDQRYGAWAQLLTLFRLIYEGGSHGELKIPARHGYLFDPDRYNFLEGRPWQTARHDTDEHVPIPRVSDGIVFRVLNNLLILDGERLSYRTLDVEQIGSVYETMMGFDLEVAEGRSIALKPKKPHGAPATINLEALLTVKAADRVKWLKDQADQALTGQGLDALKKAATIDELLIALDKKIARKVTPNIVPKGAMVLQPSDERRRSGSHYTPRSLTEPIVRTTLKPILEQLGEQPTPEQLLDLKVCDPAMGSGAFLVEVCRQLGDQLVKAWHVHQCVPALPPDEDEVLHARRLIAQRCLYGVDKNPMAVDLSKLSLWLATLAKDHPFTFLDHSLRCGDSLVGLSREQISGFHWDEAEIAKQKKVDETKLIRDPIAEQIDRATEYRQQILVARDDNPYDDLQQKLAVADEALSLARLTGDLVISAFFSADKDKDRKQRLDKSGRKIVQYIGPNGKIEDRAPLDEVRRKLAIGPHGITPFHWHIEFPEVFGRENGGFNAIVGNPPFAGKNTLINSHNDGYLDWLKTVHEESHGNADLVAHFYRRAFKLIRQDGCFGLIATNTIGQGDTRSTGLRWICTHGGTIFAARRRCRWPGVAAVVVSVVHVCHGKLRGPFILDGRGVSQITAYLFHSGGHEDPASLKANEDKSFIGSYVLGMGFTFDDTDTSGVTNPLSLMHELIAKDQRNTERIFPYIGGEEVNDSPTHAHYRYVINFGEMMEEEARQWPGLMQIVEEKVKPQRSKVKRDTRRKYWWRFGETTPALFDAVRGVRRILVVSRVRATGFAFLPAGIVPSEQLVVFPFETTAAFIILQSRIHEVWSHFFSGTALDLVRYTPSDCFKTFPFPNNFETDERLETAGSEYYEFRAALMVRNDEGLTKTYNRFQDPDERVPDILKLRELHAAMDRAVLEAYGWHDLAEKATCEFLLDYEDDEDDEEELSGSRRKKPWRYRWPDDFHDEVLARLLALNQKRAEEERLTGLAAAQATTGKAKEAKGKTRKKRTNVAENATLFDIRKAGGES
jgi:hypothetical protein